MSDPSNLVIHSAPEEEEPATDFSLHVEGRPVFTYRARVSSCPLNQVWPGYQRPKTQTEIASFAAWDMAAPADVTAVSSTVVHTACVRPRAAGIVPRVDGATIRFTVSKPGQYTLEVNGTHRALHLFANPVEGSAPAPEGLNTVCFGPGVHCPGLMRLKSGQTVYLAGGAVVHGAFLGEHVEDVVIRGRGILDGSRFDRMDLTGLICLYDAARVRIEGITLRDSGGFSIVPMASRNVSVSNVKIIGNWRYNSDGIDFINCQACRVEDSFLRTFDDSICAKGYETFGAFIYRLQLVEGQWDGTFSVDGVGRHGFAELQKRCGTYACHGASIHDLQVRRCVIWNDWGRALEIGAETVAGEIRDLVFEDCDIIHVAEVAMDVQNCDGALCRNIVFRNIRVEMDDSPARPAIQKRRDEVFAPAANDRYLPQLLVLEIKKGYVSCDDRRGRIEDIRFEDIDVTAPAVPPSRIHGHDAAHLVQRVAIERLSLNGQVVKSPEAGGIVANSFVKDVEM
jgi:hypothetical protein